MAQLRGMTLAGLLIAVVAGCGGETTNPSPPPPPPPPPPSAPVATVTLNPDAVVLVAGGNQAIGVTLKDATGKVLTGRAVTFTSNKPAIASVSAAGEVSAHAVGTAEVTASSEGKSATAQVTVHPAPVAAVQIAPAALTLDLGDSAPLAVTLRDATGTILTDREVTWESTKPAVVSVSNAGVVTALASGSAFVTARSEGKEASAIVQVHVPVAAVQIAGAPDTLEAHSTHQLQVILRDIEGNVLEPRPTEWVSSNPAVATVQPLTGLVTGLDRGNVTITAIREGVEGTVSIEIVIKYRSITAGTMHACNIASGGIAWCWGLNGSDGRIGLDHVGDGVYRAEPYQLPGDHKFTQLVTYARTTCGLTTQGRAWCWGNNGWGALGNGSNAAYSALPVPVAGNLFFSELTVGQDHACGLEVGSGKLYCWGHNDWGQFGRGNTASAGAPVLAANGMTFTTIGASSSTTCGVLVAGAAYCWGASSLGQIGDGGPISYGNTYQSNPTAVAQGGLTFRAITLGAQFACALTATGQGYCWGGNNGRLGNGSTADASSPQPIAGGYSWRMLSAGANHACGVTLQDEVHCWGSNGNGRLGTVAPNGSTTPLRAGGSITAAEVAAAGIGTGSGAHTCAISKDRLTTWCWGRNDVGQLGNGTTTTAVAINVTPMIVVGQEPL